MPMSTGTTSAEATLAMTQTLERRSAMLRATAAVTS